MTLSRHVRRYLAELLAILFFVVVAGPFASGQAVSPGQGQPVTVSGVKVGEIGSVRLREGRALLRLDIDPGELPAVYRDARMSLRPKTGLNDMAVQLEPGTPPARRLHDRDSHGNPRTDTHVNPD
jgi:phospholipid/cholesterol/gamma-HCH transport system substrate-binding protein